jgi:hypothetical protein
MEKLLQALKDESGRQSGKQTKKISGNLGEIQSIAFSPDRDILVSGSHYYPG